MKPYVAALCAIFVGFMNAKEVFAHSFLVSGFQGGVYVEKEVTLDDLFALPQKRIETSTSWDEKKSVFEGVSGDVFMEYLQLEGDLISAIALDLYSVEIPMVDFLEGDAMIAIKHNGSLMDVADKGPFWVVYDYDNTPVTDLAMREMRSIWQLHEMIIE